MVGRAVYKKVMRYQKTGVDVFFDIFSTVQQSGQAVVTQVLEQSPWIPSFGKKSYTSWMQECAKGTEVMKGFVDQGYSGMDQFWPLDISQKAKGAPAASSVKKQEAIKTLTSSGLADAGEAETPKTVTAKPAAPAKAKTAGRKTAPRKKAPSRSTPAKAPSVKAAPAKAAPKKRASPRKATQKTSAAATSVTKAATKTSTAAKAQTTSSPAPAKTAVKPTQVADSAGKSDS